MLKKIVITTILLFATSALLIASEASASHKRISIRMSSSTKPKTTPTVTPKPSPTLAPVPSTPATSDKKSYIMNEINTYRASNGLSNVATDPYTCEFAKVRAKEVSTNFSHDGFRDRINNKTLPYPKYSYITENIAMNSNYKNVVASWIASSGHAKNMRADTPFVCVEFYGNYYAYEGWKP